MHSGQTGLSRQILQGGHDLAHHHAPLEHQHKWVRERALQKEENISWNELQARTRFLVQLSIRQQKAAEESKHQEDVSLDHMESWVENNASNCSFIIGAGGLGTMFLKPSCFQYSTSMTYDQKTGMRQMHILYQ